MLLEVSTYQPPSLKLDKKDEELIISTENGNAH
jgi:hypothetical protein